MQLGDNNPLAQIFQVMKMQSLLKYFTVDLQRPAHAEATLTSDTKKGHTSFQQALKAFCWAVSSQAAFFRVQKDTSRQKWVLLPFFAFHVFVERQHPTSALWTIHPH